MNKDMEANLLETFGKMLMEDVWDQSVKEWADILSGRAKAPVDIQMHEELSSQFSQEQLDYIARIIPSVVETTLFNFMVMIDDTDWLDLTAKADSDAEVSLKGTANGLHDYLFEWISAYPKQPRGRSYELLFGTSGPFLSSNRND